MRSKRSCLLVASLALAAAGIVGASTPTAVDVTGHHVVADSTWFAPADAVTPDTATASTAPESVQAMDSTWF
jgi:hypothetical protein